MFVHFSARPTPPDTDRESARCERPSLPILRADFFAGGPQELGSPADSRRIHRLSQQLCEARRAVEVLDQSLGMIAHELRAPLTSLRLLTEHLMETGLSDPDAHGAEWIAEVTRLHEIMLAMGATLDNLVDAARLRHSTANWREVDLRHTLADAVELVRLQAPPSTSIHVEIPDEPPPVMSGDGESLRRLAVNLLANACRHTPEGVVRLSVQHIGMRSRRWVILTIADTGEGIDLASVPRLGQPFARGAAADREGPGGRGSAGEGLSHGLGLWICRHIASLHGGRLAIRSAPGCGTMVSARLRQNLKGPVVRRSAAPIAIDPTPPTREAA